MLFCLIWAATVPTLPVSWDAASLTLVREGAVYGRMARTPIGSLVCAHEWSADIWLSRHDADGWGLGTQVAAYAHGPAANPEIVVAPDGSLLCAYNERPTDGAHPFAIAITRSDDDGHTWEPSRQVYRAGVTWESGCWEPALLALPSGEIQLFFANEHRYPDSREQEVALCRSFDGGATWTPPRAASFRAGHRDGMPVPLRLLDGSGSALAIEDDGIDGVLKPAIVFSPAGENWSGAPLGGDSERRWPALAEEMDPATYAGAPYLRQLSDGRTVLSVQSDEGTPRQPHMTVYVGDAHARCFGSASRPFAAVSRWNSLFVHADDTITAGAGVQGVWTMDGRLTAR